jgi:hypothetical protein
MAGAEGQSQAGVEIWARHDWMEGALAWIDALLGDIPASRTLSDAVPRIRSWSTVIPVQSDRGNYWFKAAAPATAYEIRLYPLLAQYAGHWIMTPVAVDAERGRMLLPDGGPSLLHSASGDSLFAQLETIIPHYARLRIRLRPQVQEVLGEVLGAGTPDMRPDQMPTRFDEAMKVVTRISSTRPVEGDPRLLDDLAAYRSTFVAKCEVLSHSPIPPTLDHSDLHPNNILPSVDGTPRFYDWGDSVLAHPFSSMLVFLRSAVDAIGAQPDDPRIDQLRDAYLHEFRAFGSHACLVETLETACRVSMVTRALTWDKALALDPNPNPDWVRAPLEWMASLLDTSWL